MEKSQVSAYIYIFFFFTIWNIAISSGKVSYARTRAILADSLSLHAFSLIRDIIRSGYINFFNFYYFFFLFIFWEGERERREREEEDNFFFIFGYPHSTTHHNPRQTILHYTYTLDRYNGHWVHIRDSQHLEDHHHPLHTQSWTRAIHPPPQQNSSLWGDNSF